MNLSVLVGHVIDSVDTTGLELMTSKNGQKFFVKVQHDLTKGEGWHDLDIEIVEIPRVIDTDPSTDANCYSGTKFAGGN